MEKDFEHTVEVRDHFLVVKHDRYGLSITLANKEQKRLDQVWIAFNGVTGRINFVR